MRQVVVGGKSWSALLFAFLLSLLFSTHPSYAGHEVLAGFNSKDLALQTSELVIMQFDNRPVADYWNISARWNRAFAQKHGHQYMFLSMKEACENNGVQLSSPWCKVKAMIAVMDMNPTAKAFLYLDSDALITQNYSMTTTLSYMKKYLDWDWEIKPFAFNQDGPGWACKLAFKLQYNICFNSGTVFWLQNIHARKILQHWWQSSTYNLTSTRFKMNWRQKVSIYFDVMTCSH